jgi:hypothetical protein
MSRRSVSRPARVLCAAFAAASLATAAPAAEPLWVTYEGGAGPGRGKHVVLVSGDEEYRSEEGLPQLGKILAKHHGFRCTVLFAIDPQTGEISPNVNNNIPGLEALATADAMIIATRFRNLPDDQMQHVADYLAKGKPVIGLRTATHAFNIGGGKTFSHLSWNNKTEPWAGGFGRRVLGETWISHHGAHGSQSTRGVPAKGQEQHPILRGVVDVWGPTDVYGVRLPLPGDSTPLLLGQVLAGMKPEDVPVTGPKNDPLMPVAWIKTYRMEEDGPVGRAFATTMGSSTDLASAGLRRVLVNATYWAVGLEDRIPAEANVEIVGTYEPTPFGFNKAKKGVKPADHAMK